MTNWNLIKQNGCYYVDALTCVWNEGSRQLLLVRHEEGDCDTVSRRGRDMHTALYDLYQTNDNIKKGDTFAVRGTIFYRCEGVDVVAA